MDVQCGLYHTVALSDSGEVWVWGSNSSGQHGELSKAIEKRFEESTKVKDLGYSGDLPWACYPTQVPRFDIKSNRRVTLICTGSEYILAVENNKKTYAWGKNSEGQLGIGKTSPFVTEPETIKEFVGIPISHIAAGESHTLVVDREGDVYAFGSNTNGRLGLGSSTTLQLSPKKVVFEEIGEGRIILVACGVFHSLALDDHQNVYSWGGGLYGQLGHNDLENHFEPMQIDTKTKFKSISAGKVHSAAINTDDHVFIWGLKEAFMKFHDAFGIEETQNNNKSRKKEDQSSSKQDEKRKKIKETYFMSPTLWDEVKEEKIFKICLGDTFNVMITSGKTMMCWGNFETDYNKTLEEQAKAIYRKDYKELGENEKYEARRNSKVIAYHRPGVSSCMIASLSSNHIYFLTDSDELYTWGHDNFTGRLGLAFDGYFEKKSKSKVGQQDEKGYRGKVDNHEKVKWFMQKFQQNKKELEKMGKDDEAAHARNDEKSQKGASKKGSVKGTNTRSVRTGDKSSKGGRSSSSKRLLAIDEDDFDDDEDNKAAEEKVISDLKHIEATQRDTNLQKYDADLKISCAELLSKFEEIRNLEMTKDEFFSKLEAETFKRIAGPPFGKNTKKKKGSDLPEEYTLNSKAYKMLVTVFQMHPCYLIKLYDPRNIAPLFEVIKDLYGDFEMDQRKTNMFILLTLKILDKELPLVNDFKKLYLGVKDADTPERMPLFNLLFNYFVLMQRNNVLFLRKITKYLGETVAGFFQGDKVEKNKFMYFLFSDESAAGSKLFNDKYKNESDESRKRLIRDNVKNVRKLIPETLNKMGATGAVSSATDTVTIATKYLFYKTIEAIKDKFPDQGIKHLKNTSLGIFKSKRYF